MKPGDVRRAAATLLSGLQVGSLFEDAKVFEVVVWSTPETRDSLGAVRSLEIESPTEGYVRLDDVADIRMAPNAAVIKREAVSRYVDVFAAVEGRDAHSVAEETEDRIKGIAFPIESHAEVIDSAAPRRATQTQILTLGITAAVMVLLLMQAAFSSWRLAALLFVTVPLGLLGGLVAVVALRELSVGPIAGLLAVAGVAARHGIMLIRNLQRVSERGDLVNGAAVMQGAQDRVAPVVVSTLVTALALIPLTIFGDVFGYDIVRPMAIVALGSLITSAMTTLFIVPALYLRLVQPVVSTGPAPTGTRQSVVEVGGNAAQ